MFGLNHSLTAQAFPFHLVLDRELSIVQTGKSIQILFGDILGGPFTAQFEIKRPRLKLSWERICSLSGNTLTAVHLDSGLEFRFQTLFDNKQHVIFLVGSPKIKDKAVFKRFGLKLSHFAGHDALPDYLMVLKPLEMVISEKNALMKQLKLQKMELKEAHDTLEEKVKERTQDLLAAKELAESGHRAKNEFLAMMSHEIRTPMNGIVGMSQILKESPLSELQRDYIDMIMSCGDVLLTIIDDILDFSKIEANMLKLETHNFDLIKCIEDALDVISLKAYEKQLTLGYTLQAGTPSHLKGDSTRLRQVFINLLSNAVKFTHTGEVTLNVSYTLENFSKAILHFKIRDTGIGIAPESIDKLFQAFTQTDSSITRKYGGTGLGLTICKKLVGLMGGKIWVESEVGSGSTFHFTAAFPIELVVDDIVFNKASRGKALVIDSQAHGALLANRLSNKGIQALLATSLANARDLLEKTSVDFCISDHRIDSTENVIATYEHVTSNYGIPCFLITHPQEELPDGLSAAGPQLHKPVQEKQLQRILEEVYPHTSSTSMAFKSNLGQHLPFQIAHVSANRLFTAIARKFFQSLGYEIRHFDDLNHFSADYYQTFDIVFVDVALLSGEAPEILKQIRDSGASVKHRHWIALVDDEDVDLSRLDAAGMFDAFVQQPGTPELLVDCLIKADILRSASATVASHHII